MCQATLPRFPMTSNPCAASWLRDARSSTPNAPRAWRRKAYFPAAICRSKNLERFPITWNHVIEKESLGFKELEHVLVEKVEQLFRDML